MNENKEENVNVSRHLRQQAQKKPKHTAVILADGRSISFEQLEAETSRFTKELQHAGIKKGMRVATFVRPGFEFVPSIFALFRLGAVPVFIDPGMKFKNMLACIEEAKPEAMLGIPLAFVLKSLFFKSFASIKRACIVSRSSMAAKLFSAHFIASVTPEKYETRQEAPLERLEKNEAAAIIFTSGSTGVPKGVEINHGIFEMQQHMLKNAFDIKENEVDLIVFPLFALFSAAWGLTAVIPKFNPAKPAKANGKHLAAMIQKHEVTHTSGSPAIWKRLGEYCEPSNLRLPSLKRILMAGAPVPESIVRSCKGIMSENAHVYTPYGATEALPLTLIRDDELMQFGFNDTRKGKGVCVGRPMNGIELKVMRISSEAIRSFDDVSLCALGEVGEIIVQGEVVTRSYFNRPDSNAMAKIFENDPQKFWHRMGDLGYFDEEGRLWIVGRKDHRVELESKSLYPVQCEGVFNQHPQVVRTALVGVETSTNKIPVLVVQAESKAEKKNLESELKKLGSKNPSTETIETVIFKKDFPVDVRHNIKIDRPALARFAKEQLTRT